MEEDREVQIKEEMRQAISGLVEAAGCSRREARLVLQATGGDLERAKGLVAFLNNKSIWIIKAKFKGDYVQYFGLFSLILNTANRVVYDMKVVVSKNSRLFLYDVNITWDLFEKVVHRVSLNRKDFIPKVTQELFNRLKDGFRPQVGYLWDILKEGSPGKLKDRLGEEIWGSMGDLGCELRFSIDQISSFDLDWAQSVEELPGQGQANSALDKVLSPIKLKIALILAVEGGIPLSTLRENQPLLVRVIDNSELGIYLAQLMGARKGEHLITVVTAVEDLQPVKEGMIRVRTKFGEKVVGEAVVANNVRVKLAPQRFIPTGRVDARLKEKAKKGFPYLLVTAIIVIIWIILSVIF
ncbi:MAG: hypothetical protein AB1797_03985 [bacterium]